MLNRVSRLVTHDAREFVACAAFHIEHLTSLKPNEARVCEVEGNGESGHALGREPFFGEPYVWPEPKAAALERLVELGDAWREPCPLDCEAQVLDAELKQSFVGPGGPWEASTRWRHSGKMKCLVPAR